MKLVMLRALVDRGGLVHLVDRCGGVSRVVFVLIHVVVYQDETMSVLIHLDDTTTSVLMHVVMQECIKTRRGVRVMYQDQTRPLFILVVMSRQDYALVKLSVHTHT